MTNYSRIKKMTKDELASELSKLSKSEALPFADFDQWLSADNPQLRPKGKIAEVEIYIQLPGGHMTEINQADVIIIEDKHILFGTRYYKIFDIKLDKIFIIPFANLEIRGWRDE